MTAAADLIHARLAREGIVHAAEMAARQRDEARRGELQDLAGLITSGTEEPPAPEDIRALVAGLAHRSLSPGAVRRAWRAYLDALQDQRTVKRDKVTHPGCSEADLRNWCEATADAALNLLLYGGAR